MPTKTSKKSLIATTRREYEKLDRAYHKIGDQTLGTSKNSKIRRDYQAVKRERNRVGRRLGQLTGRKPRRGR